MYITKLASASWSPSFFSKVLAPIAWNFTVNYPRAWLVHKQFGGGSIPPGDTVGNIGSIRILCIICIVNRAWFNTFCTIFARMNIRHSMSQLFIMCVCVFSCPAPCRASFRPLPLGLKYIYIRSVQMERVIKFTSSTQQYFRYNKHDIHDGCIMCKNKQQIITRTHNINYVYLYIM